MLRIQYGGTFDPVHQGHLAVARSARDRLQAEVWLMPAADPPHKPPTEADAGGQYFRDLIASAVRDRNTGNAARRGPLRPKRKAAS